MEPRPQLDSLPCHVQLRRWLRINCGIYFATAMASLYGFVDFADISVISLAMSCSLLVGSFLSILVLRYQQRWILWTIFAFAAVFAGLEMIFAIPMLSDAVDGRGLSRKLALPALVILLLCIACAAKVLSWTMHAEAELRALPTQQHGFAVITKDHADT